MTVAEIAELYYGDTNPTCCKGSMITSLVVCTSCPNQFENFTFFNPFWFFSVYPSENNPAETQIHAHKLVSSWPKMFVFDGLCMSLRRVVTAVLEVPLTGSLPWVAFRSNLCIKNCTSHFNWWKNLTSLRFMIFFNSWKVCIPLHKQTGFESVCTIRFLAHPLLWQWWLQQPIKISATQVPPKR